jgi:enoyl-CoA hydratase/carnithine racemase
MTVKTVSTGDVKVAVEDHVVMVTIDRPAKKNALTQEMYATLSDALEQASDDGDIGALVITGTGSSFTAGNDLADFSSGGPLTEVMRFLQVVSTATVPLVAAVNGLAIGVGLTMLLHCDLVYVEPEASLFAPFVELGLVPEAASSLLLPRVVGERRASEILLSGRKITGLEAVSWGLANEAASPVLARALRAAQHLASLPPQAVRTSKALLRSNDMTVQGRMAEEMSEFDKALGGSEFPEVIAARAEKRPAVFR